VILGARRKVAAFGHTAVTRCVNFVFFSGFKPRLVLEDSQRGSAFFLCDQLCLLRQLGQALRPVQVQLEAAFFHPADGVFLKPEAYVEPGVDSFDGGAFVVFAPPFAA